MRVGSAILFLPLAAVAAPAVRIECDSAAARAAAAMIEASPHLDGCGEVELRLAPGAALHDGYRVARTASGFAIEGTRPRSFLYAAGEVSRWASSPGAEFTRSPRFAERMLNYGHSRHSLAEWTAASGCNIVHLGRNVAVSLESSMPEVFAALAPGAQERLRQARRRSEASQSARVEECHALDLEAAPLLYGCDPLKWNRELAEAFLKVYPDARAQGPSNSWEKFVFCPSSPATWRFVAAYARDFVTAAPYDALVVTFWDDYGLRCSCPKCRKAGMDAFGAQVAKMVETLDGAVTPLGKRLIVRTWASGAPHWLRGEWVNAPGYASEEEALATWSGAVRAASPGVVFQTKVYNSDCQPNPPFSHLLGKCAGRPEYAEWQITGQTVGLQFLPASVAGHTLETMRRVDAMPSVRGVCLYAGGYKNPGYEELDDPLNSCNLHIWRQLSWNPADDIETVWREWAGAYFPPAAVENAVAAMKLSEGASVASFSPLGLGAPTESRFAGTAARREDLLRYTNRQYTPEGQTALAPISENIRRVAEEKDAALAEVRRMKELFAAAPMPEALKKECLMRTRWLEEHLFCSKALDTALWRYRRIRYMAEMGLAAPEELKGIDEAFDLLRAHHKKLFDLKGTESLSFYPDSPANHEISLRSPVPLMRDIREKAAAALANVAGPE